MNSAEYTRLREHEDAVVALLDPMPRIRRLIALRQLRTLLGVPIEDTAREISMELKQEMSK